MDLLQEIDQALDQWQNMQTIYNEVNDPLLVETVIHQLIAAERRYDYLLRLAKAEDLYSDKIPLR